MPSIQIGDLHAECSYRWGPSRLCKAETDLPKGGGEAERRKMPYALFPVWDGVPKVCICESAHLFHLRKLRREHREQKTLAEHVGTFGPSRATCAPTWGDG